MGKGLPEIAGPQYRLVSLFASISFHQYVCADKVITWTNVGWGPSVYLPAEVYVKTVWYENIKVFRTERILEQSLDVVLSSQLSPPLTEFFDHGFPLFLH